MEEAVIDRDRAPVFDYQSAVKRVGEAPAEQLMAERLVMFALVAGIKPRRILEIGTHWGGSASIMCAAMDLTGVGNMVTVDPNPLIPDSLFKQISHRVNSLVGLSPDILPAAIEKLGGTPDFVFIDGDHSYEGVKRDFEACLEVVEPNTHFLFHDSHYFEISDAIDTVIAINPRKIQDSGTLTSEKASENRFVDGRSVDWGGLRLLRVCS